MDMTLEQREQIVKKIISHGTFSHSSIHGPGHWQRVAEFGCYIAEVENLDSDFLYLFAYFHDCQRLNDGRDVDHGPRAAAYILDFDPAELCLDHRDQERLAFACEYHTYEVPTSDREILACWDSDRLDLPRVGIKVDSGRLFTKTAKDIVASGYKDWDVGW